MLLAIIGFCALTPKTVVTFDNQKLSYKMQECETLVAADCSESPDFAIYGQTTANNILVTYKSSSNHKHKAERKKTLSILLRD